MKVGLGSYAFRWSIGHKDRVPERPMTAMDLLDIATELGVEVLQYADNLPLHRLADAEIDAVGTAAKERGITLEVGTSAFDVGMVRRYLAIARRLDARILRIALDKEDAARPVHDLANEMAALIPELRAADVRLAVENHFDFPSRQLADLVRRVDSDRIGVCLDVANSICAGEWPEETVGILAPLAINLHLKDYVIQPDPYGVGFRIHGAPLGTGRSDLDGTLRALPGSMSVIYEHWLPWPGSFDAARKQEAAWTGQGVEEVRRRTKG